jgi:superfamily I DNA/RNA helicase
MDAFEDIRRQAEALHDRAVAQGADPWVPWSLAAIAAEALGCQLNSVPSGHPLLRGGVGCYDPELGLIIVEALSAEGERALLAGHELGHVVVHRPAGTVVTVEVHADRVPEPSSAVEKLVDYGERERREVQMDLFAREFVFPRGRARRLFLDQGLPATAIADRCGLPYPVVAQQIFDAVLLPSASDVVTGSSVAALEDNKRQDDAVTHEGSPFLLQAGPGTGKTRTLIKRIERLLDDGIDPEHILVLTFSNKAAGELRDRLSARRQDAAAVWIGTFHAFGLDILRRFADRAGLPADPKLVDRVDAVALIEQVLPRLELKHYRNVYDPALDIAEFLQAISRAKDEVVDAAEYEGLARAMLAGAEGDGIIEAEKILDVAKVYRAYEQLLTREQRLDFGDLVMRPVKLVEQDAEVAALLRAQHTHVLVDEYQDVNRASVRLLKAVVGSGHALWAVGDSRQSIYRFRGASSANLALFASDFPGAQSDSLDVNYRSSSEVVDMFSTFAAPMLASLGALPLALSAKKGASRCKAELRKVRRPQDEAPAVGAAIEALRAEGVAYRDQAVLCRGNKRLAEIAEALEARGIPILYLGSLFEREEIKDLMALLALLVDPRAGTLPRVAGIARYRLSLQEVAGLLRHARESTEPLEWTKAQGWTDDPSSLERIAALARDLEGFGAGATPWRVLAALLLDRGDAVRTIGRSSAIRDRISGIALWQFLTFCAALPKGKGRPVAAMLERVSRLVLLSEERDLRQMPAAAEAMDAVRMMTVHGSKGLEFEAVHIPGMTKSSFPGNPHPPRCLPPDGMIFGSAGLSGREAVNRGHKEEEECLFFVALSRAKRHVRLYATTKQASGTMRNPSDFLGTIAAHIDTVDPAPLILPERDAGERTISLDGIAELVVTQEQLQLYKRCPLRYFYTHLLNVPGARRSTGFARMHDVVYKVLGWLRDDPEGQAASLEAMRDRFEAEWAAHGPLDDPNAALFRNTAAGLVDYLLESRSGSSHAKPEPITLAFGRLSVTIVPDDVRLAVDGLRLRRVRTGKRGKSEIDDDIAYALYVLAAEAAFDGAPVEAVHLTDRQVTPVEFTKTKLNNRREKVATLMAQIASGAFPPDPDDERMCPRCPHFVTCGAVPAGPLSLDG